MTALTVARTARGMSDTKIPLQAIGKLIEYMEHDERKHYEQMKYDGEDTSNHIYNSVKAVTDWLDAQGIPRREAQAKVYISPKAPQWLRDMLQETFPDGPGDAKV